jgi:hypothetical protein
MQYLDTKVIASIKKAAAEKETFLLPSREKQNKQQKVH